MSSPLLVALLILAQVQTALAAIVNTVVVTGNIGTETVTSSASATVTVEAATPAIALTKTGTVNDGGDGIADIGDTITYQFTVTNAGNITLTSVTVSDPLVTVAGGPIASLAPGASDSTTFTASYVLTAADVGAAQVANTATASASPIGGGSVTGQGSAVTPLSVGESISLTKTGTLNDGGDGRADVGDSISYQFVVTNTGSSPVTNVKVSDPKLDFAWLRPDAAHYAAILAADPTVTGAIDVGLKPSIVEDAPRVDAGATLASLTTDAVRALPNLPDVATRLAVSRHVLRTDGSTGPARAGEQIALVYVVTNTGDAPLTGIEAKSRTALAYDQSLDVLPPGQTDRYSFVLLRTVEDADIARGVLTDDTILTASARGRTILKAGGDAVDLVRLDHSDELLTAVITPANVGLINPGQQATFTASYTLTQADIDAGVVNNTATATATGTSGNTLTAVASASVPIPAVPGVALVKTSSLDLGADNAASIGDLITYSFAVTNTGNVTLTNITVSDPLVTVAGGPIATLAPGQTNTTAFTATYALTQPDVDAGQVSNQATVAGDPPAGGPVSDPSDDNSTTQDDPTVTPLAPLARIALVKTAGVIADSNGSGLTDAGDTLSYTFAVTNTGNVTLTNITVADPLVTVNGGPLASLAPGATDAATFTASYGLTQADLDAGQVSNQATVSATAPDSSTITDRSDDAATTENDPTVTPLAEAPAIALVKTVSGIADANGNGVNDTGDTIAYAFTVTNTGNVTLGNVTVTDPLAAMSGGPLASLAPGASDATTFTATYVITAADMIAGQVSNQATASAASPTGPAVTDLSDNNAATEDDPTVTPVTSLPGIGLVKTVSGVVDQNGNGMTDGGDIITYAFTVRNTGNIRLINISLSDPKATVTGGPLASLDPGVSDSTTFTASYVLTVADVMAGQFQNQASASGTDTGGTVVSDLSDDAVMTEDDPTVVTITSIPGLALVKTVSSITDVNGNSVTDTGDIVNYAFAVSNTGNVPLANITVSDPLVTVSGGPLAALAAGQTDGTTFTAAYTVTPADTAAGSVSNQATASGTAPNGSTATDLSDDDSITGNDPTITPTGGTYAIALIKAVARIADRNGNGITDVGDVIHYRFTVTNTGNQPLSNITVADPLVTVKGGPLALLNAGQSDSTTFTASYTITAADADAGKVVNQATATGQTPAGTTVSDQSDESGINDDDPTVTPVVKTRPKLAKVALTKQIRRGETAAFEITASSVTFDPARLVDIMPPGFTYVASSATANGRAVKPVIDGRRLVFDTLSPNAKGVIKLKLTLRAGASAVAGTVINNAELYGPNGANKVLAKSSAALVIVEEATFDCADIIGRVFDDRNQNGYMDEGEAALPAVRLATVNGLLITTDKNGRYHIPCAGLPDPDIGSNFVLKLDRRTLPTGFSLTTENPGDVRLTRGKVVKLNFGAALHRLVRVDLRDAAFNSGETTLRTRWTGDMKSLLKTLDAAPSVLSVTYTYNGEGKALAAKRAAAFKALILKAWGRRSAAYELSVDMRVVRGE